MSSRISRTPQEHFEQEKDDPIIQSLVSFITDSLHRSLADVVSFEVEAYWPVMIRGHRYQSFDYAIEFVDGKRVEGRSDVEVE